MVRTLAMIKMHKNFSAIEKGYPREPYIRYSFEWLLNRLKEEVNELEIALKNPDVREAMLECADVSNCVDYIFEKLVKDR